MRSPATSPEAWPAGWASSARATSARRLKWTCFRKVESSFREGGGPALPGSLRHPLSGDDPREGDDDDRDSSFGWGRFGPGWTPVAPTQARCGATPVAG